MYADGSTNGWSVLTKHLTNTNGSYAQMVLPTNAPRYFITLSSSDSKTSIDALIRYGVDNGRTILKVGNGADQDLGTVFAGNILRMAVVNNGSGQPVDIALYFSNDTGINFEQLGSTITNALPMGTPGYLKVEFQNVTATGNSVDIKPITGDKVFSN